MTYKVKINNLLLILFLLCHNYLNAWIVLGFHAIFSM